MSTFVTVQCAHCGEDTQKTLGNVNRANKKGGKLYCDHDCSVLDSLGDGRHAAKHEDTVSLECATCGVEFDKCAKEHRSRVKKGKTEFYCSRSCGAKRKANLDRMADMHAASAEVHNIADYAANRADEFTGLREHLRRAKQRGDKYEGLTLEHLLIVWDRQQGRCAFTGVDLEHPGFGGHDIHQNYLASLDRIDSSVGYKDGNVQFVSATVNYLKNDMSSEGVYDFFDIVRGIRRSDSTTA